MSKFPIVVAGAVAALALAPAAHADADTQFINALSAAGYSFGGYGKVSAIQLAHWVCDNLDRGVPAGSLSGEITNGNVKYETVYAGQPDPSDLFVGLAVKPAGITAVESHRFGATTPPPARSETHHFIAERASV
jgi:hypothetical protein